MKSSQPGSRAECMRGRICHAPWSRILGALIVVIAPLIASAAGAQAPDEFAGTWGGSLEFGGTKLPLVFHLEYANGAWSGTADSPMQGATGMPLTGIKVQGAEITFSLRNIPGNPTYQGKLAAGALTGTFTQSGRSFPLTLTKSAGPARPQTPKPPFPYTETEVVYHSGDVDIAGTLAVPEGAGPFPAVLLLSGSGAQNRDEEIFGHRPFFVISDNLARAGIAVLRVDDRGVGKSTGSLSDATIDDLARDAVSGVRFMCERSEINPLKVGLIGHSEGAVVASLAAAQSDSIAFIVLMAGAGVPGADIIIRQVERLSAATGAKESDIRRAADAQKRVMKLVVSDADSTEIAAELRKIIVAEALASGSGQMPAERELNTRIARETRILLSPGYRSYAKFDPRPSLTKIKVPVLALAGDLDLQVDPDQNIPEISKALESAGNADVTIHRFPGLNHLFQTAKTGTVDEYYEIEETIQPGVLTAIREWIVKRVS